MGCLIQTRPEIACTVAMLSQVAKNRYPSDFVDQVKELNHAIHCIKAYPRQGLTFIPLDYDSMYIKVSVDGAFANNHDISYQLGQICFSPDDKQNAVGLHLRSYKSRHVVR